MWPLRLCPLEQGVDQRHGASLGCTALHGESILLRVSSTMALRVLDVKLEPDRQFC